MTKGDKMKEKIKFKDLSGWLQMAILGGAAYFILFLVGFVLGILSVVLTSI